MKRVRTFKALEKLALQRRSVHVPHCFGNRHMPAAILIHWPAILLMRILGRGIYEYKPKPKEENVWRKPLKKRS